MKQIMRFELAIIPFVNIDADNFQLVNKLEEIRRISSKLYAMVLEQYKDSLHEETTSYINTDTHKIVMCKSFDESALMIYDPNTTLLKHLNKGNKPYGDSTYDYTDKTIQELVEEEKKKEKEKEKANEKDNV